MLLSLKQLIGRLRFQHLALLMTIELFLLGIAFPDATNLIGDALLFFLLAPLQFFNRYLGLKLSGESRRVITIYRHIFTVILLVWLLLRLLPEAFGLGRGINVMIYAALALISGIVLMRIVYKIWTIRSIHSDVLFGIIICYATVIVMGFELHAINHQLHPGAYNFLPEMKHHSQLLFLSMGSTTTLGGPITVNTTTAQLINYFQSYVSQVFLVVFVSRMIGLHTGSNKG